MSDDGFVLVRRGQKRCAPQIIDQSTISARRIDVAKNSDAAVCGDQIERAKRTVQKSSLFTDLVSSLSIQFENVVCYGLGNFSNCSASIYQLSLLLLLRKHLSSSKTIIFDPLFTSTEINWLKGQGLTVPDQNSRALDAVTTRTLFFLPHCGRALLNNVLYANFTPAKLAKIVIVGNGITEMYISDEERNELNFVSKAREFCTETRLPKFEPCETAFNDLAVIQFDRLPGKKSRVWKLKETAPAYELCKSEII